MRFQRRSQGLGGGSRSRYGADAAVDAQTDLVRLR
jgi:hypothetical protein